MDIKAFEDYSIAEITSDELQAINELEKKISNQNNDDIILIAYRHDKAE